MSIAHKNMLFGSDARIKLKSGVDKLARAVSVTLGAKGRNVIIDKELTNSPVVTKDGVTVAKEVILSDKEENTGVRVAREAAMKTNAVAGDGTTTSIVLTHAIFSEGLDYLNKSANSLFARTSSLFSRNKNNKKDSIKNPIDVSKGMEIAKNIVHEYLTNTRQVIGDSNLEIEQVATISANNDPTIGKVIAEAIKKVTKDGVVVVEQSKDISTAVDVKTGMQYERGWVSPYFVSDEKEMVYEAEKPAIFVFDRNISNTREILNILEGCVRSGKNNIVLIANDFTGDTIPTLVANKMQGTLNICCIKSPSFGARQKEILQDIAIAIGGTCITDEILQSKNAQIQQIGTATFQNPQLPPIKVEMKEFMGTANKVVVEKDKFTIIDWSGTKEAIDNRIDIIKSNIEKMEDGFDKDEVKKRLARFTGGIAVIKVGAATEVEMKEKKDRFDDAISATRAAIEEGIIQGGGTAFVNASLYLEKKKNEIFNGKKLTQQTKDLLAGYTIVQKAIQYPFKLIISNAGLDGEELLKTYISQYSDKKNYGYDVVNEAFVDMVKAGIVDPVKVTKTALENAVSSSSMLLTTECVLEEEIDADIKAKMLDPTGGQY